MDRFGSLQRNSTTVVPMPALRFWFLEASARRTVEPLRLRRGLVGVLKAIFQPDGSKCLMLGRYGGVLSVSRPRFLGFLVWVCT
jgi:hypothetical protein